MFVAAVAAAAFAAVAAVAASVATGEFSVFRCLISIAPVQGLAAPPARCLSPCLARVWTTVMVPSSRDVSALMSHCVPTSHTVVSSKFPLVNWRSNISSSSYLASAAAMRASVGKFSVRLMASCRLGNTP